tara:strand:- start:72 stop:404 length:333 start_codon:yes stop_codon:yes gene_type:complete
MNFGYLKLYTDGSLQDAKSHKRYDIFCPASEEKISEVAWAEERDAKVALIAAEKGFKYWPMLLGLSLIISNIRAYRSGEWNGVKRPFQLLLIGLLFLIIASIVLGYSNIF